ncbi:type II toxin-antitoxin system Phd/YefM family antitoxin [Bosea sp. RAC05]|jgi:prevent-host-death family protein|uniref:type II toxin-antitoxin system Phd/YefM family antitoxin n=1 Tax=Bosea sp. RAC05 TaxID=1842539 RepID=UPI00083DBBC9|nr:type II toxin-antitoxin system prevent-host-death family antitoxin [Bosea sp. RAC05]AOG07767.1 prevent-host-death family protein [Bosea sp. RAC05]
MTVVNVHEAKTQLSRLIEQALRGEEVVIARNGVPAVKLVQIDQAAARKPWREPGQLAGLFVEVDPDWWKPDDDLADLFEGSDSFENRVLAKRDGSP